MPEAELPPQNQDQKPPAFKPAILSKTVQQISQLKLPKPVQIKKEGKIPKRISYLLIGVGVLAVIFFVLLMTGIVNLPGSQKEKSKADQKVATSSSSQNGTKNTCVIYTRKGAASKTTVNKAKEGDQELTIKFREGSEVRLRDKEFVSLCGEDLSRVNNLLSINSDISIKRSFSRSEEDLSEEFKTAKQSDPNVADLNLFYRIILQEGTPQTAVDYLVDELNKISVVEIAYPEPSPAPAP